MNMKNFPKRLDSKTSYLRITVPENLDLALEGLIRKVLKEQPKIDDIYSFAADYFETLLTIRDKTGAKFKSDQLCPFHNDEDAHEMIKIAGTFSKRETQELRRRNEESLPPKIENVARNKEPDGKVQNKKSVGKSKLKKLARDEVVVEQNKQTTSKVVNKLPVAVKDIPEEVKNQTNLADKRPDDINLEQNTKKIESDDEEFLASDPIKELVEKELMENKIGGKQKEIKETAATDMDTLRTRELTTNNNIEEKQELAENIKTEAAVNDTNGPIEKENLVSKENVIEKDEDNKKRNGEIEETEPVKETEIKVVNNEVTEEASENSRPDVKEEASENSRPDVKEEASENSRPDVKEEASENRTDINEEKEIKPINAETSDKRREDMERENIEHVKDTAETNSKGTINLNNLNKKETEAIEETNKNTESTEEAKITTDRDDIKEIIPKDEKPEATELEEKALTQEIQSKEKVDTQSTKMSYETTDRLSEALHNVREEEINTAIYSDTTDINPNLKEEEKDVKTSEEKESKGSLNDQQTVRVNDQIDMERETNTLVDTSAKDENSEVIDRNEAVETSVVNVKPPDTETDTKGDTENLEMNNNQKVKALEEKMNEEEEEPKIKTEATDPASPKEIPNKTEEFNDNIVASTEQQPEVTEQIEIQEDEPKTTQSVLKSDEKPSETAEDVKEPEETKTDEVKLAPELVTNADDSKPESETAVIQIDSKDNSLKGEFNELSSVDKESYQSEDNKPENSRPKLISDAAGLNEEITSEKNENERRVKITEDALFGERTHDLEESLDNEGAQTTDEIAVIPQLQNKKISEKDEQVSQNVAEFQTTNKESARQEEDSTRKLEDEVSASPDLLNTNKSSEEKLLKSDTDETQSKDSKIESEKESREEGFGNQAEDEVSEGKIEREVLNTENQIPEDNKTSSGESKQKFETSGDNEEDKSKPEEELCTVVDVQQIPKEDAIDENKLEEKYKPEADNTPNKEIEIKVEEGTIEDETGHKITVEEPDKNEENQKTSQPSSEIQIKTIQSHMYDTLQVPDTVTREYRVHNVPSQPMGALLNVVSSLQQSHEQEQELLNTEEQIEKAVDVKKAINVSSSAEPTETATPKEDLKVDNLQSADPFQNSRTPTSPSNASDNKGLDTQKNDSDDLLDVTTPISDYSLNLSELSWQTINELFLESEKRNSSENRYVTTKTSRTADEPDDVEEIIHKVVVSSGMEAVPDPPRDLEANVQTPEDKKEDKPEGDSADSSDSSNEQISVNEDTPFISVEVKTVIETQILDDDDETDQKEIPPDMEIKVETTIDYGNEVEITDSEPAEDKMETTVGTRNDLKSSLEVQDNDGHDKPKESSSSEQTTGGEGSSVESDSTISSAATEIKRANFAKRNFSSTQSFLSTQSLDLDKKHSLMKTRSLSTFRHGVTDFEVWNAIEKELEEAATKIQSKFRGYKTRKKLQRENAVQITTEESSVSVTPVEEEIQNGGQRSTGEFHDSIVLSEHPR